jgi:hypothetical protein
MVVVSFILFTLLIAAGYVIWNLNNKVSKLENIVESQIDYLRKVSLIIQESNVYINKLDEKGHFRSDDEVGTFFNFMKEIQDMVNDFTLPKGYGEKADEQ